jgi:glycosyltransferase involved in cell wall biosynthesis
MNPEISVVIPFLNESENIDMLVAALGDFFSAQKMKSEVIFINDGSTDDSVAKLMKAEHRGYKAKIISFSKNFGSHAALRAGIYHATGEHLSFMYADLQDPLNIILDMQKKAQEGNDIVWAYRKSVQVSFGTRLFSQFYASLMRRYAFPNFPENNFDIVMINRKIMKQLNQNIEGNSSIFLQIFGMGFKQASIYYDRLERKAGKSKWTTSKKIKLMIDSFVAFSYAPIRFVTMTGFVLFFLGLLWSSYMILRALLYKNLNQGWPSLIAILTIGFGITNISLGIIAEYLWRTLDASRKREVFIIDEIIDISGPKPE